MTTIVRWVLRAFVPSHLRPIIVCWTEMLNICSATEKIEMPATLRRDFNRAAQRQAVFLEREFGLTPPWPAVTGTTTASPMARE